MAAGSEGGEEVAGKEGAVASARRGRDRRGHARGEKRRVEEGVVEEEEKKAEGVRVDEGRRVERLVRGVIATRRNSEESMAVTGRRGWVVRYTAAEGVSGERSC